MKREIIVRATGEAAVTEDGRLVEYFFPGEESGAVILGRVERIAPGMQAAFVDIGEPRNGFLPLAERSKTFAGGALRTGDRVPVQIRREAQGAKGAMLSRDITLAGEYLLYMPCNRYIGVSARVEDAQRERLRALGAELAGGTCGLVLRTAAVGIPRSELAEELERLQAQWREALRAAATAAPRTVLLQPDDLPRRLLADYAARGGAELALRDDPEEWRTLERQRDAALGRTFTLPGGGTLVIDPCEALTAIDVNTAADTGSGADLRATILRTNLAACPEIARLVRLRNHSGILMIDMIDMAEESDRQAVLDALREAFARDRVKTVIHGYTALGLVEMSRRRSRRPLAEEIRAYEARTKEEHHG